MPFKFSLKLKEFPAILAVAKSLIVNELTPTEVIVDPVGMPGPDTSTPGARPDMLATFVTTLEEFTMSPVVAATDIPLQPDIITCSPTL